jgi:hypothetical protein
MWYAPPEVCKGLEMIASSSDLRMERDMPSICRLALSPWIGHLRDSAAIFSRDFRMLQSPRKIGCRKLDLGIYERDRLALEEAQDTMWCLGMKNYVTNLPAQLQAAVYYWMELRK